jgi:hypothetical protein
MQKSLKNDYMHVVLDLLSHPDCWIRNNCLLGHCRLLCGGKPLLLTHLQEFPRSLCQDLDV